MRSIRIGLLTAAAMAVQLTAITFPNQAQAVTGTPVREIRTIATAEFGLPAPRSVTWASDTKSLLVTGAAGVQSRVAVLVPTEERLETLGVTALPASAPIAADPAGRLVAATAAGLLSVPTSRPVGSPAATRPAPAALHDVIAVDYDRSDGSLVALAAGGRLIRVAPDGQVIERSIQQATKAAPTAVAVDPQTGQTYVAAGAQLVAIGADGRVLRTHDLSDARTGSPQAMVFAPTSDPSDAPDAQHLFLVASTSTGGTGELIEATLAPLATTAAATTVTATLVRVTDTFRFSPPSPDPSGIAFLPSRDRLMIGDGEVDEMSIFAGTNMYETTRAGSLTDTGVSTAFSNEPVGVGYNPLNDHLFISDDDKRRVSELVRGPDGRFGTSDDTVTGFGTSAYGNTDPEGIEFDTATGSLWLSDGLGTEVYRVLPGPNGRFDGISPNGDDIASHFDTAQYGAGDPEGMGYDAVRNTLLQVDDSSASIYELDRSGSLLTRIDISAVTDNSAAGVTIAPASDGSGRRNYYVVTRGVDNDSHPSENDGRLWELRADLGPATNQAPNVNAGPDQQVILPASATLTGSASDDGLPNPPGALSTAWSKVSGPGTVTFADSSAPSTTASFSEAGTYALRLTANDSELSASDDVTIEVLPAGSSQSVDIPIAAGSDDAEQSSSGAVSLSSSDLELVVDGSVVQTVGLRFAGLPVPPGATVLEAYVQFTVDEVTTGAASLTIQAQAADNAGTFQSVNGNISSRPRTAASVGWVPATWPTVGAAGVDQRTPNLAAVVQQVVNRPGWAQGNAVALIVTGTGRRTAEAFEGTARPVLHLRYQTGTGGGGEPTNQAPVVSAGPDQSVTYPASVTLAGSATDDGLPDPPGLLTTTWSQVSGPGTVTFADAASPSTTATASAPGSYVLRLTADDSELTRSDDVTVQWVDSSAQPVVLDIPIRAGADDAEQRQNAAVQLDSSDLDLMLDGSNRQQMVGLRFTGVAIPQGATIVAAYVQFRADEASSDPTTLTIWGEAADNAAAFQAVSNGLTSRARTAAQAAWSPPAWPTVNARGPDQRTASAASILQEVVDRSGWSSGNAVALLINGSGKRIADAFEGGAAGAPVLHVEWLP